MRWLWAVFFISANTLAATLPYSLRTKPYSGFETGVRGDTRTVGMSGATLGLGDTFIAGTDNPAGMAMTMGIGDDNFTHTHIYDAHVQDGTTPIDTNNAGLALNFYPWTFSFGYLSPYREESVYDLPSAPGHPAHLDTSVQELRLSTAHVMIDNRLSLGLSLNIAQAETGIEFPDQAFPSLAHHAYDLGFTIGATYRLPEHLLLGTGLTSGMQFSGADNQNGVAALPGFYQSILTPWRGGVGLGWIPNRFFRADFSTFLIGTTSGAALLGNQSINVGNRVTLQPRMGAAYVFCDFKNLQGTLFFGSYYEVSRIEGADSRFHKTIGTEIKPWILTVGIGTDMAPDYQDHFFSVGVDVFKVLEQLSLIPINKPPRDGFLPNPFLVSDVGLSRPLTHEWKPDPRAIDPIKSGLALPGKIKEGVEPQGDMNLGDKISEKIDQLPSALTEEMKGMKKAQDRDMKASEVQGQ